MILPLLPALLLSIVTPAAASDWALAIHGGAGVIERKDFSAADDAAVRADLGKALDAGAAILEAGGSTTDAVLAAVTVLETSPWFNAAVGATFTSAGTVELDAAIMEGASLRAGAVAGVSTTLSPITLARTLMDKGPHLFLAGPAADGYARANSLTQVPNSHFHTDRRFRQLELWRKTAAADVPLSHRMGTVGAVARDRAGNLAAGTSTGGLTGKAPGRIGDAPLIGAGTLADNRCGTVSTTGTGEIFIRARVASQICDRARFAGQPLQKAADEVLAEVKTLGGSGGLIVLGPKGDGMFLLNSLGMHRGRASAGGLREIKIYGDE